MKKILLRINKNNIVTRLLKSELIGGIVTSYKNQKTILGILGIPYTEDPREDGVSLIQINTIDFTSFLLALKARREGTRIIIITHTTPEDMRGVSLATTIFSRLVAGVYLKAMYGLADLLVSPSEYTKKLLIEKYKITNQVEVISNGLDVKKFNDYPLHGNVTEDNLQNRRIRVLCVALVLKRKGVGTFIKMSKKFPDVDFVWCGKIFEKTVFIDGSVPREIPDNVSFAGYVDDIARELKTADIFFFPSYEENEGIAVLEACACKLPILVRDIGAYGGWMISGENCLKARNNHEFHERLDILIKNPRLRKALGESAYSVAQERDISNIARKYQKVYNDLLNE